MKKGMPSKAERDEVVTKGYFYDYLENVFAPRFRAQINEDFAQHIRAVMEDGRQQTIMLIEAFQARFERIEAHLGI